MRGAKALQRTVGQKYFRLYSSSHRHPRPINARRLTVCLPLLLTLSAKIRPMLFSLPSRKDSKMMLSTYVNHKATCIRASYLHIVQGPPLCNGCFRRFLQNHRQEEPNKVFCLDTRCPKHPPAGERLPRLRPSQQSSRRAHRTGRDCPQNVQAAFPKPCSVLRICYPG